MAHRRNAAATRQRLLWAAFREFHRNGFRGADLDQILVEAEVTKGALYHHFRSKKSLGYAVVDEILMDWMLKRWLRPVAVAADPLEALKGLARWGERAATPQTLGLGCPLLNLSQELSGIDEGFRSRIAAIYEAWRQGLVEVLSGAQDRGIVRAGVDTQAAAVFLIAAWEGSIGLAKPYQSAEMLGFCRQGLEIFLQSLEAPIPRP